MTKGRPKTGVTKLRTYRMNDDLHQRADAIAERRGETFSALLERAVEREVRRLERNPTVDLESAKPRYRRRKKEGPEGSQKEGPEGSQSGLTRKG